MRIRDACTNDLPHLASIEREAASRFLAVPDLTGMTAIDLLGSLPHEQLVQAQQNGTLWVAADGENLVGFLAATLFPDELYVLEIDVLPSHGRRGLGKKLLGAALSGAAGKGLDRVVLRTFQNVPWNAPFYRRFGFRDLSEKSLSDALRDVIKKETEDGLKPDLRATLYFPCRPGLSP